LFGLNLEPSGFASRFVPEARSFCAKLHFKMRNQQQMFAGQPHDKPADCVFLLDLPGFLVLMERRYRQKAAPWALHEKLLCRL
jgi:hypothetical protein